MNDGQDVTRRRSTRLDLGQPGARCGFRCRSDGGPPGRRFAPGRGNALLALSSALASAPIADDDGLVLRRLCSVRFEDVVPPEDFIQVDIAVDATQRLASGRLAAETTWTLTTARGETIAELKAEIVCSDERPAIAGAVHERDVPTRPAGAAGADDADAACVDNIPV